LGYLLRKPEEQYQGRNDDDSPPNSDETARHPSHTTKYQEGGNICHHLFLFFLCAGLALRDFTFFFNDFFLAFA
jgi:hypothetical protein